MCPVCTPKGEGNAPLAFPLSPGGRRRGKETSPDARCRPSKPMSVDAALKSLESFDAAAMTVADLLREARACLAAAGGDGVDARVDAEILLARATGLGAAAIVANAERGVPGAPAAAFQALVARRAGGEPVAYLTGRKEFWSLELTVTPAVLIPRPETELLVEQALACAAGRRGLRVLDLGTGSGAVALALAFELRGCAITATDSSPAAIAVARANHRKLAAAQPGSGAVEFRIGDWFAALPEGERFDLIVCNPPYIAPHDPHLRQGDLRFEPRAALVSARGGLADLAKIITDAPPRLNPGGALLLEHGHTQAAAVRDMLSRHNFTAIATDRDLGGHERVTHGIWGLLE